MQKLLILCLLSGLSFASMQFEKNQKCAKCHPTIYSEYQTSQHANATIFKDPIHQAVYNLHPQKNKKQKYRCAFCHTPTANNLKALVIPHNGVIPDSNNATQNEAVACAYCHRIKEVSKSVAMNKNHISTEQRVYFSNKSTPKTSPFHGIKPLKSIYKEAKICMGCHSHKANKHAFNVCATNLNHNASKKNCIECHMHQIKGAPSTLSKAKTHSFHGFIGLHGDLTNLSDYITMKIEVDKNKQTFKIMIDHTVPHASTLHPLRASKLEVNIQRGQKIIKLKTHKMAKKIGKNNHPTPPWLATRIIEDTTLKANEKKSFIYHFTLKKGDIITAQFGHFLVKPKLLKKLKLEQNKEATKFRIIQKESIKVQ